MKSCKTLKKSCQIDSTRRDQSYYWALAVSLLLVTGCAELRSYKVNAEGAKISGAEEGIPYYMPRPFIAVKQPFPINGRQFPITGKLANGYVTFDINSCWSLGVRQEWFRDDDGARVAGLGSPTGIDWTAVAANWQEVACGINYRPKENWTVRSEARWDRFDPFVPFMGGPFDDFNQREQFIWSLDLIVGF